MTRNTDPFPLAGDAPADASQAPRPDVIAIAALAKALAHPARVQIVDILMRRNVCIGCDIVEEIGLAASTTSEHLRILKAAGIVVGEIERPRVCYSLNPDAIAPLRSFLSLLADIQPARLERRGNANNAEHHDNHAGDRQRDRHRRAS